MAGHYVLIQEMNGNFTAKFEPREGLLWHKWKIILMKVITGMRHSAWGVDF